MSLTTNSGVNTRPAEPPTITLCSMAVTWTAAVIKRAESLRALEKTISSRLGVKEKEGRNVQKREAREMRRGKRFLTSSYR